MADSSSEIRNIAGGVTRASDAPALSPLQLAKLEGALDYLAVSITAPFAVPYAVANGAGDWQVGLLTALPLLAANASQVPAARWGARSGHPRTYMLAAGGLGRLTWLALALLLLSGHVGFTVLIVAVAAASVSNGLVTPLWTSFLGERVPEGQRGSYFGTLNFLSGVGAMAGAFIGASLVSAVGYPRGSALAIGVAVLVSSAGLAAQIAAIDPRTPTRLRGKRRPAEQKLEKWNTEAVRRYVAFGVLLILGAGMATPFHSVYFINRLGGSPQTAATVAALGGSLTQLGQGPWGWVVDRVGVRTVGIVSLAAIAGVPLLWLAAPGPGWGVAVALFNGLVWAGAGIAIFNVLLAVSNDANRASVVAWVNTLQAPANFGAPLIGGFLAERAGISALFAMASVVLAASWVSFLRVVPARGKPPAEPADSPD